MKRILISILLVLLSVPGIFAQKVIGSYTLSHFNKSYPIELRVFRDGEFYIEIDVEGRNSNRAFIEIEDSRLREFLISLDKMKNKFHEWSKVATDNNVTEMMKYMGIEFPYVTINWRTLEWFSDYAITLHPQFLILEDGTHLARIAQPVTASSNKYIKNTIYWIFSSTEEFDELLTQLDEKKIAEIVREEEAKSDLFK